MQDTIASGPLTLKALHMRERTLTMLKNRPSWMTYELIGEATGLPARWIAFFVVKGHNPPIAKLEILHTYLKGQYIKDR